MHGRTVAALRNIPYLDTARLTTARYFKALTKESPTAGWVRPTLEQMLVADEYIWTEVGTETRGCARTPIGGTAYPIRVALEAVMKTTEVATMLGPQWAGVGGAGNKRARSPNADNDTPEKKQSKSARQRANKTAKLKESNDEIAQLKVDMAKLNRDPKPSWSSTRGRSDKDWYSRWTAPESDEAIRRQWRRQDASGPRWRGLCPRDYQRQENLFFPRQSVQQLRVLGGF